MTERVSASFRDPAGFVFNRGGTLYRQVNDVHRAEYEALMKSGLYDALVDRGLLVRHVPVDIPPADAAVGSLVIRPELVPFVSYPFEWCPGQLRAAGAATLEIQRVAIEHGMSLRDASAYNIQFLDGKPVLIDTLSFERLVEGRSWVAYGQYCRHFLAPLALMRYVDVRLGALLREHLDGIPLDLAARLLPRRTQFTFGLGVHVHAHARSQRRHAGDNARTGADGSDRQPRPVSRHALLGLVDSLRNATRKQQWNPAPSVWRDYYEVGESYSDSSAAHKGELIADMVSSFAPRNIWDLGANTGHFSQLVAKTTGAHVVALEMDPSSVEVHWQRLSRHGTTGVLPLLGDLANPTPAQGWAHRERDSLEQRGPADGVLALALIHHLAIGNNVPLPSIMAWFARLGTHAIVEWIPKDDPMVRRLLTTREDVFPDYNTAAFERAVEEHFRIVRREPVKDSLRTLYLLDRR